MVVGSATMLLLEVEVYLHICKDKNFSEGVRVSSSRVPGGATKRIIISPKDVRMQVFLADDPTDTNHLHVFRMPSSLRKAVSLTGSTEPESEEILEF